MLYRIVFFVSLSSLNLFKPTLTSGVFEIGFLSYALEYENRQATTDVAPVSVSDTTRDGNVTSFNPWPNPQRCSSPPRYKFYLCLERGSSNKSCDLGHEDIPYIQIDTSQGSAFVTGHDRVLFGNRPLRLNPRLQNPIQYRFQSWVGPVFLNVYVECCGTPPAMLKQCKEKLSTHLTALPLTGLKSPRYTQVLLKGRAILTLMLSLYCLPNFYGAKCERFCHITNPNENRICHPQTGDVVCRPGLTGDRCNEDKNECDDGICQNGGECINHPGTFQCICRAGVTTGRFCEFIIPSCPSNPCKNGGTCEETNPNYRCHCRNGWKGVSCETKVSANERQDKHLKSGNSLKLSVPEANSVAEDPKETKSGKFLLWYIGIGLLVLTVLISAILILCVIWSGKRGKYKVPTKCDASVIPVPAQPLGGFDNNVYLRDPEILDLRPKIPPSTSTHYQRALVSDREYTNVRPMYEDRIVPDDQTASTNNGIAGSRERNHSDHHLLESRRQCEGGNVYVEWNNGSTNKENAYEEIDIKGLSSAGVPWSDCRRPSEDVQGIVYRKTSSVSSGIGDTDNTEDQEKPSWLAETEKRKFSSSSLSGGLANWPSETNKRKKKAGYDLTSAWKS